MTVCYPAALKTKRVIWNQRPLLAYTSSEAKRVMVMLAEDCGRARALLCIMDGGGVWKEGGYAWVQRGRKFGTLALVAVGGACLASKAS